jgi:hypothetical protein
MTSIKNKEGDQEAESQEMEGSNIFTRRKTGDNNISEEIKKEYKEVNQKRWDLGKFLVKELGEGARIIPVGPYYGDGDKAGKIPALKGWPKKTPTTIEELDEWKKKNDFYNLVECNI